MTIIAFEETRQLTKRETSKPKSTRHTSADAMPRWPRVLPTCLLV